MVERLAWPIVFMPYYAVVLGTTPPVLG